MSYQSQTQLASDIAFQQRVTASATEQAGVYKDDTRADIVALAVSILRVEPTTLPTFFQMEAASPGFAIAVDKGNGTIDSSVITDAQILATTQAIWPTIAGLFYDPEGAPL